MSFDIGQQKDLIKDTKMSDLKDIRNKSLQIFENKEYFKIAITKAERLASALYLVSNLIDDGEPMKWTVRKVSIDMISDIVAVESGKGDKGQKISITKISAKIFEMTSLLQVAWMGGLISGMNFEILKTEYFRLGEFLKNKFHSTHFDDLHISKDFFSGQMIELEEKASHASSEKNNSEEYLSFELKNISSHNPPVGSKEDLSHRIVSAIPKNVLINPIKDILHKGLNKDIHQILEKNVKDINSEITSAPDKNKKKRHDLILSLLKSEITYTVPEILGLIGMGAELSEKTIQRDLIYLVSSNLLKKTGERRWSRYALA